MQAIIRRGNGRFYCSPIFGKYYDKESKQAPFDAYVICFDEKKEKLIKYPLYDTEKKPYLDLLVLITDDDESNWINYNDKYIGVDFISYDRSLTIVEEKTLSDETKKLCHELDHDEDYSGFKSIHTYNDIKKFMLITGQFHDAWIAKLEERADGSLYVLFDGVWGCNVEIVFFNDVSYSTDSRDPNIYDPYWLGSSIIIKDGYIYFVDDVIADVSEITDYFCWFKAKEMKYRIIPE